VAPPAARVHDEEGWLSGTGEGRGVEMAPDGGCGPGAIGPAPPGQKDEDHGRAVVKRTPADPTAVGRGWSPSTPSGSRWHGNGASRWTFENKPSRARATRTGAPALRGGVEGSDLVDPSVPGDGLAARAAVALADWLSLEWWLFVTVASDPPYGVGGHRACVDRVRVAAADREGIRRGAVGGVGFTQRNGRGGLHAHALLYRLDRAPSLSPGWPSGRGIAVVPEGGRSGVLEPKREGLGLHRVLLARSVEAWARSNLKAYEVAHLVEQRTRVTVLPALRGRVESYCARYSSRSAEGDMFEVGRGLTGMVRCTCSTVEEHASEVWRTETGVGTED